MQHFNFDKKSEEAYKNFQIWNEGSKLKNEDDEPLILYHGTHSSFNIFDLNYTSAENYYGKGFYFTDNVDDAVNNYESSNGKDRENRISNIYEMISNTVTEKEMEKIRDSEDFDTSLYVSLSELFYELKTWTENETIEFHSIMQKLHDYLDEYILIVDSIDDVNMELAYKMHDILFNSNYLETNKTIPAYVKMTNPFDTRNHKFVTNYVIGGDFENLLNDFIEKNKEHEEIESFKDYIKENITFHIHDYDKWSESGTVYKNDLYEMFSVEEEDGVYNFESCLVNSFLVESFLSHFEQEYGDDIQIDFVDDSFIQKFYNFLGEDKNLDNPDRDDLFALLNQEFLENGTISFEKFEKLCKESDLFLNCSPDDLTSYGQCFSEFIQTLGYDGIIMSASKFHNMKHVKNTTHYILFNPNNIKLADGSNVTFSLENNDIRYKSLIEKPSTSINEEVAIENLIKFHIEFPNLTKTILFKTQEQANKFTSEKCKGFYISSKDNEDFVGIVLENVQDAEDFNKVLIHEHIGHSSMKKVLGKSYEPTMLGVYDYFVKKDVFKKDDITRKEKIVKAEERFAESVENNDEHKPSLVSRVSSAIMNKARKVFPSIPFMSFEINNLFYNSFNFSKKNKKRTPSFK